jgi:hypothetical protein
MPDKKPENKKGQRHGRWESNTSSYIYIRNFVDNEFYGLSYFYYKAGDRTENEYYAR